ncbi:MAG: hypothetical protein COA97_01140 [Flavobacteriales bacterium]|nr:MAG: hypothetical protein COA97_01140 [Flavobacteriales bacterium]
MLKNQHIPYKIVITGLTRNLFQLIVILFLASQTLNAQYFNNRYPVTDGWGGGGLNAIENDSGYISVGVYLSLTTGKQNIHVLQTDFNGNITFQKIYGDNTYSYFNGFQNSLTKLVGGGYALYGGKNSGSQGSNFAMLFRFNEFGDTLWTKTYGDTVFFQTGRHMRQALDGGFILFGDNTQTAAQHWVIKTDSLGNIEWQQTYGGPAAEGPRHIAVCTDGGYIFTGLTQSGGVNPSTGNIRITKIDSLGNVVFNKFYGLSEEEVPWSIEQTQDGGYIFGGGITFPANNLSHPYVMRLDNLGDTLWTKVYPAPTGNSPLNYINTIFELPDGSFIAGGMDYFTDSISIGKNVGFIVKIKANGDTLWRKEYILLTGPSSFHEIKDIRPTTDGGFICSGVINPAFPDTGTQDMWLFKIDSNGCVDTSNCWVSVGIKAPQPPKGELVLYPNPTSGVVTIEIPKQTAKPNATFHLIDITGKEVLTKIINSNSTQLDVGWLPKGIYFYRYLDKENQFNYSGKLVVN